MFTFNDRDRPRMPMPMRAHLIVKPDPITGDRISELDPEVDGGSLPRLAGSHLKGTFKQAYMKLSRLAERIGWDDLLRYRSEVFVMEEEYRQIKAEEERKLKGPTNAKTVEKDLPKVEDEQPRVDKVHIEPPKEEDSKHLEGVDDDHKKIVSESSEQPVHQVVDNNNDDHLTRNEKETPAATSPAVDEEKNESLQNDVNGPSSPKHANISDLSDDDNEDVWAPRSMATTESIGIAKPQALDAPKTDTKIEKPTDNVMNESIRPATAPSRENTPKPAKDAKVCLTSFIDVMYV